MKQYVLSSTLGTTYCWDAAMSRVQLRKAIEEEMLKQSYSDDPDASTAPRMTHRFMAKPTDVNWGGNVHGGTAMEWIDEAASACTSAWTGERTVAVYAGGFRFYRSCAHRRPRRGRGPGDPDGRAQPVGVGAPSRR